LYNNDDYHNTLEYSFGLNGYLDNLLGLGQRYKKKQIGIGQIIRERNNKYTPTNFKDAYFPSLGDATPVKNSYALDKHMLITGPNAAGKTTLLKTTIFNIILSQQTGFGFYKSANIILYDYIHCYINIPDTSARDSLFQAEARRCKDILTSISETSISETSISETSISETTSEKLSSPYINEQWKDKTHLCVFDELYSGTNPYEAIGSAYAFLSYLNKFDNVNFVLTTHYLDLCKRLEETQKGIHNYHMEVLTTGDDFNYTYKMKRDISTIKGGVKVLRDLDYPKEIIDVATHFLAIPLAVGL
jgi:DNA mismatch repair ATPase MutS